MECIVNFYDPGWVFGYMLHHNMMHHISQNSPWIHILHALSRPPLFCPIRCIVRCLDRHWRLRHWLDHSGAVQRYRLESSNMIHYRRQHRVHKWVSDMASSPFILRYFWCLARLRCIVTIYTAEWIILGREGVPHLSYVIQMRIGNSISSIAAAVVDVGCHFYTWMLIIKFIELLCTSNRNLHHQMCRSRTTPTCNLSEEKVDLPNRRNRSRRA